MTYTVEKIIAVLKAKGHAVFEDDKKNYNLNIVGIRSANNIPDSFDDLITVFWKFNGEWHFRVFPCTTDPGLYWLKHPMQALGTAIVKEGQYRGVWQIALHQGKYKALCQRKPITIIRDFDRDGQLDFDSARQETGIYGINGHRANENGKSIAVGQWSAGCQVLQNREIFNPDNQSVRVFEFDYFMSLCDKAAANFGNSFTYTLINEKDFKDSNNKVI